MNNFLIPSNSKRSMLIFGLFRPIDLGIFITGGVLTFLLIFINSPQDLTDVLVDLLPLLIAVVMVTPIPNQMNIWSFTVNVYSFLTHQRDYRWRGWCKSYGDTTNKEEQ
jgi:hypothetical protein